jgi:hypothetical protein
MEGFFGWKHNSQIELSPFSRSIPQNVTVPSNVEASKAFHISFMLSLLLT